MNERFAWAVPYAVAPMSTAVVLASGVVLAALAGLLPSHAATRTPIVEGLRLE
jgi:ABC-type lipoprotein release transport system permease subunit